jgi:hypothetical protein
MELIASVLAMRSDAILEFFKLNLDKLDTTRRATAVHCIGLSSADEITLTSLD